MSFWDGNPAGSMWQGKIWKGRLWQVITYTTTVYLMGDDGSSRLLGDDGTSLLIAD
ncbi:MAG: hypothetical protein GY861_24530 [bacterium]|nr:hypothetical protein [bacterium]